MTQALNSIVMPMVLNTGLEIGKPAPSAEAIGKFQALMDRADMVEPSSVADNEPSNLGRILGAQDVQMQHLVDDMNALPQKVSNMSLPEVTMEMCRTMNELAMTHESMTIVQAATTAPKKSIDTLLKNQ
jgi:type III secretion system HrpB2-like protein